MEKALDLVKEIDKILELGQKGLAKVDEAGKLEKEANEVLKNNLDFNSEFGREYEKWSKQTFWKIQSRDGFATQSHLAPLERLREFLTRFLDNSDVKSLPTQQYIKTGEVYTGRRILKDILSRAKNTIDIQDNYLDTEIFVILEEFFRKNPLLKVRLLTSDRASNDFKSDLSLFSEQFGEVSAKTHNNAHGRFVLIDNNEVYSTGHSLKGIGKKADVISKIEENNAKQSAIEDFEKWWKEGNNLVRKAR